MGAYVYDNTILKGEDTLNAFVYKQNPEFTDEATLQLGSAIYIWLTVDSAKTKIDSTLIISPDSIPASDLAKMRSN